MPFGSVRERERKGPEKQWVAAGARGVTQAQLTSVQETLSEFVKYKILNNYSHLDT